MMYFKILAMLTIHLSLALAEEDLKSIYEPAELGYNETLVMMERFIKNLKDGEWRKSLYGKAELSIIKSINLLNRTAIAYGEDRIDHSNGSIFSKILAKEHVEYRTEQQVERVETLLNHFKSKFGGTKANHEAVISMMKRRIKEQKDDIQRLSSKSGLLTYGDDTQRISKEKELLKNMYIEASQEQRNTTRQLDEMLKSYRNQFVDILMNP